MLVTEYDLACYKRKWQDTYAVHLTKDKTQRLGYIQEIGPTDLAINYGQGVERQPRTLLYYHIPSRYYRCGQDFVVLIKKFAKAFNVGLSSETHYLLKYRKKQDNWISCPFAELLKTDILNPLTVDIEQALNTSGPIDNRFFLGDKKIFYLDSPIGIREGRTLFLMSEDLRPDLYLKLRGYECQIIS